MVSRSRTVAVYRAKIVIQFVVCFVFALSFSAVSGQPVSNIEDLQKQAAQIEEQVNQMLSLDQTEQKEYVKRLSAADATAMLNAISRRATEKDAGLSPVFYLYEHLSQLKATDLAEKRLHRLMIVIIVTLILFVGYLSFLLWQQNRMIKMLLSANDQPNRPGPHTAKKSEIYRGE